MDIDPTAGPELIKVVALQQERAKTLVEMAANSQFFYKDITEYDEKAARKNLTLASMEILRRYITPIEFAAMASRAYS
ncbi:MAG: hypothetical protein Q9N32_08495 [Gammaproteobacteria bacterium]|nr:hypothetical protein [Gammaproteobacteria bacterium]